MFMTAALHKKLTNVLAWCMLWPESPQPVYEAMAASSAVIFDEYDINKVLRVSHFVAQISHETGGGRWLSELGGPQYLKRYDPGTAIGARLGNTKPGDGARYKGRGFIHLTGRYNYRATGERLGLELEDNPELAEEPDTALLIACHYWQQRKINRAADRDDIRWATQLVNGGVNGLHDRKGWLYKSKALFIGTKNESGPRPTLRRGDCGPAVEILQRLLHVEHIDGLFGPDTERAVINHQSSVGLARDGICGPLTWSAMEE